MHYSGLSQEYLKSTSDSFSIKTTQPRLVDDSLVRPDTALSNMFLAQPQLSRGLISSRLLDTLILKFANKAKAICGREIIYRIVVDKKGELIYANYVREFNNRGLLNNTIISFLKKLKYTPGYIIRNKKKILLKTERNLVLQLPSC